MIVNVINVNIVAGGPRVVIHVCAIAILFFFCGGGEGYESAPNVFS